MLKKGWRRYAKVASAIGFLILIALIWFLGEWMGLETLEARLSCIVVIMLLWVASLLIGQLLARRAGGLLEKMLRQQADDAVIHTGSDKRAEVTLLRQRLLAAIDTLKKSKLGNSSGNAALYELPWYMIIGHPAAGKSSAILQSGLTFPFSDKSGIQGVGGTRNCDWFFSTEGVLLDTAGRYATQSEDRGEWLAFLKLLKKHRTKAPVNGILIAISLPELAQHHSEGFSLYVRQVRERIHEVCSTFELHVPVYLVFTKLDLLGGFAEFFQDMPEEERAGVWGCTLTANQGNGFDASTVAAQQFELLHRGLVQAGEEKLLQYRGDQVRPAHFAFPIEFHGLKEAVVKFVTLLYEDDPYHARPLLRGFYFTSALQEGTPRIVAANRVQGQFDLVARQGDKRQAPASYSFFLGDLFRKVLFPDQHLISRQTRHSGSRWRMAAMAAGVLTLSVLAGLWSWSYIGNQQLLAEISQEREAARKLAASGQLYDKLRALQQLQTRLEQLQAYRTEGAPWQIGVGLYQGKPLEAALRSEYFAGIKTLMLLPVQRSLETSLLALDQRQPAPPPPVQEAKPVAPTPAPVTTPTKPKPQYRPRLQGKPLPNIQLGAIPEEYRGRPVTLSSDDYHVRTTLWPHHALQPVATNWQTAGFGLRRASWTSPVRVAAVQPSAASVAAATQAVAAATEASPERPTLAPAKSPQLDASYNALKTYLMLYQPQRMEPAHLADQLPRYWRPYLEAQRGQYSTEEIMTAAEKLLAFYISQLKAPDLPLISPNLRVVNQAREVLRGSFKRMSAEERVFNEIRARANTRFAPLTVARILNNRDLDILAGSQMVEGAFTREAWDQYVKGAIEEASKGEIRSDDWVLAATSQDNLGKDGDGEKNRTALEAQYRAAYIDGWKRFLQGVTVRDFTSPAQSASAMTRLSDRETSPIKLILVRAAMETAWDNPSELNRSLENAKQSVLEKTAALLKGGSGENTPKDKLYGEVGRQFAGVAQLVKGDNAPINGYLEQLAKLKAKLGAIASTDDPGSLARATLQATFNNNGSELADSIAYVDNALLAQSTPDTVSLVRPMLVRPLSHSYSALLDPVSADINQAWATEVLPQWRQLAAKYPFSDAGNTASIAEINRFLKANDGTLDRFINKYLAGLVQKKGDMLVPRAWGELGIKFNPAFLSSVSSLSALANGPLQEGDSLRFELQPQPTPGLSEIVFDIDGQELRYRNGPQIWQPFTWSGNSQTAGARIQVLSYTGASSVVANHPGGMGLIRLLAGAKVVQDGSDGTQLVWSLRKADGDTQSVRVNFRVLSGVNPLQLARLNKLTLPERVTL
ncbi:type VI secretion system membrane subunit TssM [Pseudogulbenkiania ferrooxidans]|uniref:Type VI secretion protein IcmF n=1 Tax=Pseudogulbenkiania ferrooxidans 2002 TaxID=279714 RepID=B9Z7H1_9NEIS|nr:type VI secretion system membrane subunit TssM [Pseudogulbenkiania ferrooxidans]EEG07486.1 type VI secretion protein IcmF [Pseudogulbenkiania ferrooxidans 2002]